MLWKNDLCNFLKDVIYLLLERGEGRGKERERNTDVREKRQAPPWGWGGLGGTLDLQPGQAP